MEGFLTAQQAVCCEMNQAGCLSYTLARHKYAEIARAQPAMNGFFQDPNRTAFYYFFFKHDWPLK